MDPIIAAQGIKKCYGSLTAVNGIDFSVFPQECFGFLGPNGAGKTSTINLIACYSSLSGGALTIFGMDVSGSRREIKARIGVVPQENNLDPDITVMENLVVYARYFGIPRRIARDTAAGLLRFFQLEEKSNEVVPALSGGMKRRLLIARALINDPRLLILDEPTTGLDPQARHMIWEKLRGLKKRGVTMVLTTHYMEEAEQLCDRIVILEQGRIADMGTPRALITRHAGTDVVEIRLLEEEEEARVLSVLRARGAVWERSADTIYVFTADARALLSDLEPGMSRSVLHRPANLEDVFLKLTGRELRD